MERNGFYSESKVTVVKRDTETAWMIWRRFCIGYSSTGLLVSSIDTIYVSSKKTYFASNRLLRVTRSAGP